jgi:uroporphyrinogen-III synthase
MSRLDGRHILLTRSAEDSVAWAAAFSELGALPIVFPCIAAETIDDPALAAAMVDSLCDADWIVFTSRRGVAAFADGTNTALPASVRIAAVGNATAEQCVEYFGRVDLTGDGTAAALGARLAAEPSIRDGAHCLLALAANAGPGLEQCLTNAGAMVARFNVYRTIPAKPLRSKHALSTLGSDTVIFASPSAVAGFDNQIEVDTSPQFVTIGPSTSAAVRARDWTIAAEAKKPCLSGIIESMLETAHV